MKRIFIIMLIVVLISLLAVFVIIKVRENEATEISKINSEYEKFKDTQVFGTDIASLINKIVDNNERHNVPKDENGLYVDNGINSIQMSVYIKTNETTYPIEQIYKLGTTKFVENFNLVYFKCTNIEYHEETGLISKLVFEQIDE